MLTTARPLDLHDHFDSNEAPAFIEVKNKIRAIVLADQIHKAE